VQRLYSESTQKEFEIARNAMKGFEPNYYDSEKQGLGSEGQVVENVKNGEKTPINIEEKVNVEIKNEELIESINIKDKNLS
tara:strand:- start:2402 stop:2644 length:243 start_codon:yes stop_codon:yes gene_type:complete